MKRFRFRLERVLQYRETVKREELRLLLAATFRLSEAEAALARLEAEAASGGLAEGSYMTVEEVQLSGAWRVRLKEEIGRQQQTVAEAGAAVEEARIRYVAAAKEARALSLLKDKRRAQYQEQVLKDEEKSLDELTVQRHVAGRADSGDFSNQGPQVRSEEG